MYYVYVLTDATDKFMYIGVTNDLLRRMREHKSEQLKGYTKRYHIHKLVYYEKFHEITAAIAREKQLKGWKREQKNALVATANPTMKDVFDDLL